MNYGVRPCPTVTPTITDTPTVAPTLTPIPTVEGCGLEFADVPPDYTFYPYARCLTCKRSISGYGCGGTNPDTGQDEPCDEDNKPYFRPSNLVTRGQIAKIVSQSAGFDEPAGEQIYEDVPPDSTFYDFVQRLSHRGVMSGYPCGQQGMEPCVPPAYRPNFRPYNLATRGQISKIVSNAAGFDDTPATQKFEDVPVDNPFYVWIERLGSRQVMGGYPCGEVPGEPCVAPDNRPYFRYGLQVTRGQTSKIVANTFFPNCDVPTPTPTSTTTATPTATPTPITAVNVR
ncbi:MAG: S-layer homology domain-containing protein [Chloroflexota bacterium]|nr:S-layer homology domain-containing protein [Chloroflexota bacterium]